MNDVPANLQQLIDQSGGPLRRLGATGAGGYVFPVVPPEQTSWILEQRAWLEDCVLMDQTHHMDDLYISGPDTVRLLQETAINSFARFRPGMAKQYIACNRDGYLIGDSILAYLDDGRVMSAGLGPANNWLEFNALTGGYDVKITKDSRTSSDWDGKPITRHVYRYQIQGPKAWALIEKLNGSSVEDIRFFHMTKINVAGRPVDALRHGMAGAAGLEIWGPIEEQQEVLATILEAGKEFGLRQVGNRAYSSSAVESGWLGPLLPAIYTDPELQAYREWLPAFTLEAFFQLGGSFHSDKLEDYYKTPFDVGYDPFIALDHDFIGRAALERMLERKDEQRRKVTLEWNGEDVARIFASFFTDGPVYKYPDLPMPQYAFAINDRVLFDGKLVGLSVLIAHSMNARRMISLASLDRNIEIGQEVSLIWGEEPGVYDNLRVEPHEQIEIRATVCPSPYSKVARETLRARK